MAQGIFVFDVITTFLISAGLLWSYGNWMRHHVLVTMAVLLAWYFSLMIVFVIPLDVSSTSFRQCVNASSTRWKHNSTLQDMSDLELNRGIYTNNTDNKIESDIHHVTEIDINKTRGTLPPNINSTGIGATETRIEREKDAKNDQDWNGKLNLAVDAESLAYNECQPPYSILDRDVLPHLWKVVYWSSQLLTWLILPLMQSYSQAGEFTRWGKLRSALWDNAIFYSSYILIALILLVYVATQPSLHLTWDRTKAIAAAASNTWGLFVLVLLLGYGLVEVPRNLWNRSQRGYQLHHTYFKLSKLMSEKSDAEEHLEDVLVVVQLLANEISLSDSLRPQLDTIVNKIPLEMMEKVKRRRAAGDAGDFGSDLPTEKTLIKLNRQVIRALQAHQRTEAQWADWMDHAFELEDINKNLVSNEHRFIRESSQPSRSAFNRYIYNEKLEWYWKCLLRPLLLRIGAGLAAVMSLLIVWSEITFFSPQPVLSVFAAIVKSAATSHNYLAIEIVCLITVCYLCLCTYYTVFKVRILNYFYLAPNHHSDEYTLLFSGALLCRITPPLCLNFLSLIHMDSHVIKSQIMETAYTRIMGHMDVVSIISDYFNVYFPIALLALTTATYFSLGARFLSGLGFQQFLTQDSEMTQELVEEGKEHIKREKRRRQRLDESASRRKEFSDRFGPSEHIEVSGSPQNVRQRTPIAKNFSSQGETFGDRTLQNSAFDEMSRRQIPQGVQPSPERSLLSPTQESNYSDNIGNRSNDRANLPTTFRSQMNKSPPRNIFDDL